MEIEITESQRIGRIFLREISEWVWQKHCFGLMIDEDPPLKEIEKELMMFEISDIEYDFGILTIKLGRPGILIGVKGSTLSEIEDWLKKRVTNYKLKRIKIVEDRYKLKDDLLGSIISYHYATMPNDSWW